MNPFTLESFFERAGVDVSLDLVGMFLNPDDLLRIVVLSVKCSRLLARRPWAIVDWAGSSFGTVTLL